MPIHTINCPCSRCRPSGPADRLTLIALVKGLGGFLLLFVLLPAAMNLIADRLAALAN